MPALGRVGVIFPGKLGVSFTGGYYNKQVCVFKVWTVAGSLILWKTIRKE